VINAPLSIAPSLEQWSSIVHCPIRQAAGGQEASVDGSCPDWGEKK